MIRVGETRAGAVVLCGRRGARLGARGSPPARSVTGKFAHFRAAQFCFGVRAVAVAVASGNRASHARGVRAKDQSGTKKEGGEESGPQEQATESSLEREGHDHGRSVRDFLRKTDGAGELGGSGQRF